ncbi:MAG: VWA domain-containing protein [Planctomycetota bacterium]
MSLSFVPGTVFAIWILTSPWMLLWALAAIVPLLIHLWSWRRYDEVPWAAMRFLLAAIRKNARRWRLEQLILLALRMLILILLAIALADPIVARLGAGPAANSRGGETHNVLVIDASYSMNYRQTERTRFQTAKDLAKELVRQSLQGDGFTVVQLADPPKVVVRDPVFDQASVLAEIAQLERTDGGADLEATLAEIERVLERASEREPRLRRRRICFFTDLGRNTWGHVTRKEVLSTLERLGRENTELKVYDVGRQGGTNVAVTGLSATEGILTVGSTTRINLQLENAGNQDCPQQKVQVRVDGQNVSELKADVPAGGRAALSTAHRFQTPGEHVVEARLNPDRLEADNQRWLMLNVKATLDVLCVEGKAGSARHIALALKPSATPRTRVRPVIRSEIGLLEEDLRRYDCIFLCNVGRFGNDEARLLRRFLERGGGVVVVMGDQVQASNYNTILGPEAGQNRCFSARLGDPVELGRYFFDPLDYQHPIAKPFQGHERAGLLTTPVWKYVPLTLDPQTEGTTALAFQNGAPAIVEEPLGNGRVILVATDASKVSFDRSTDPPTPWSALATWPSFPPLVQQMLRTSLRGRAQLKNALVGDALHGSLPAGTSKTSVLIADPAGRSQRVPVTISGDLAQWTFTETTKGGVYTAWLDQEADQSRKYAVNLDTKESRLDRVEPDELPAPFRRETATRDQAGPSVRIPQPVSCFRYLLAALLGLLFCETTLAWLFGRANA